MSQGKKQFRVGTDDFCKLRESGGYFVDKSMLMREVIDGAEVTLLPRPRRFGKTLNLSMLRYFFERTEKSRLALFEGLAIARDEDAMAHFGRYPVIYLSLKDVKGSSWQEAESMLRSKLASLFEAHAEVFDSLSGADKRLFQAILDQQADWAAMKLSFKRLVEWLFVHRGMPVVVLLDEYDSPMIEAWRHGFLDEMMDFMRSWLGGGLKHENGAAIYRTVVTGILRIAKESLFSGLNNLKVCSILHSGGYADKFGFTEAEVDQLLVDFDLQRLRESVRQWYNGYSFGGVTIYNPWSVICAVDNQSDPLSAYWLNTASNALVYAELEAGGLEIKRDLEKLLTGDCIRHPVVESTVFSQVAVGRSNIWSFLLFTGYLRAENPQRDPWNQTELVYELSIPNLEVSAAYRQFVDHWHQSLRFFGTRDLLESLLADHFSEFERLLGELVRNLVSVHDVARYPEAAYHALTLGLLANLRAVYEIRSNPESGYGRADIVMLPKTMDFPLAYVMEFKVVGDGDDIDSAADSALEQIASRAYDAVFQERGVSKEHQRRLAIVVAGKRVRVRVAA